MSASCSSPLVDVALSFIADDQPDALPNHFEVFIRAVVSCFVAGGMGIDECKVRLSPLLNSMRPLDRVDAILHCSRQPLPSNPGEACFDFEGKRRPNTWSETEDNRLLCAIHRFGMRSWPVIASFVGNNRTRSQCAQRWRRGLDPRLSKNEWTAADDMHLIGLVENYGQEGWTYISQHMGNRSDVQCRYRYLQLKRAGRGRHLEPSAPSMSVFQCRKTPPERRQQ